MIKRDELRQKVKDADAPTDSTLLRIMESEWSAVIMAGQAIFWLVLGGWITAKILC